MSVSGIEALGFKPTFAPTLAPDVATQETGSTQGPTGPQFGQLLAKGVEGLEGLQDKTDGLAVQAATGDLNAIHDYTIAATETSVATQLTVAVRNKAVEAFNEIMRMQV
jgi:flagellar hook-basal body complex protein FliE